MILVENKHIDRIPVLHLADKNHFDEKLPLSYLFMAFTSAKEHNLHYAYLLAERGFRVVFQRPPIMVKDILDLSSEQLAMHFWNIVLQSIDELRFYTSIF